MFKIFMNIIDGFKIMKATIQCILNRIITNINYLVMVKLLYL